LQHDFKPLLWWRKRRSQRRGGGVGGREGARGEEVGEEGEKEHRQEEETTPSQPRHGLNEQDTVTIITKKRYKCIAIRSENVPTS
jgi:hypothetical protein